MATATNPETGEKLVLSGDQWLPVEQSATDERGRKAYLAGGKWIVEEPVNAPTSLESAVAVRNEMYPKVRDRFSEKYDPNTSALTYAANQLGLNVANLGKMIGQGAAQMAPFPIKTVADLVNAGVHTRALEYAKEGGRILGVDPKVFDPNLKPPGPGSELAANVASDIATNFMLPGGSTAQRVLGGVGSAIGREAGKAGGVGGEIGGSIVGGVMLPALGLSRIPIIAAAIQTARGSMDDVVHKLRTNPAFMSAVREDALQTLAKDLRKSPDDFARTFAEAQRLEQAVPGLKLNLAQRFLAPNIVDQQRMTDAADRFQAMQLRGTQEAALKTTIGESPSARAMAEGAIEDITTGAKQRVASLSDQIAARAKQAEELSASAARRVDIEDLGERALAVRWNLLLDARKTANGLMDDAVKAARVEEAIFDAKKIADDAANIRAQPVWDDANFPAVFGKLQSWSEATKSTQLPFEAIRDMRQAVNADIAGALKSNSPNARAQLHNLHALRDSIDATVANSPYQNTRDAYDKFNRYYRYEFTPRFLRGVNLAAEKVGARGEPILPGEKVFDQYFKEGNATNMARYLRLYGDNTEAMDAMRKAVIDRYAREVIDPVNDLIRPRKHAIFFEKYARPLHVLERQGYRFADRLRDAGKAFDEVIATRAALEDEVTRINGDATLKLFRDEFGARSVDDVVEKSLNDTRHMDAILGRMNEQQTRGFVDYISDSLSKEFQDNGSIHADRIRKFLADNTRSRSYMSAMARVNGVESAKEQMKTLRDIADIVERMDVTPVPAAPTVSSKTPGGNILKDEMQKKIGLSYAVIGNMLRAVVRGNVSPEWAGLVLGGQVFATVRQNLMNEVYKEMVNDPGTATRLLAIMRTQATSPTLWQRTKDLLKHSPRIAAYMTGLKEYPQLGAQAGANIIRERSEAELTQ